MQDGQSWAGMQSNPTSRRSLPWQAGCSALPHCCLRLDCGSCACQQCMCIGLEIAGWLSTLPCCPEQLCTALPSISIMIPPKACSAPKLSSAAAARHICARLQVGEDAGKLRMALAAFLGRSTHGWADLVGQEAVQELAAAAETAEGADQVLHLGSPWPSASQHGSCWYCCCCCSLK